MGSSSSTHISDHLDDIQIKYQDKIKLICTTCNTQESKDLEAKIRQEEPKIQKNWLDFHEKLHIKFDQTSADMLMFKYYMLIYVDFIEDLRHIKGGKSIWEYLRTQLQMFATLFKQEKIEQLVILVDEGETAFNKYTMNVLTNLCYTEITSTKARCIPLTDSHSFLDAILNTRYQITSLEDQINNNLFTVTKNIMQ